MARTTRSPLSRVWFSGFFGTIAVGHLLRALIGAELHVAGQVIPTHWSWTIGGVALIVSAALLLVGKRRSRTSPPDLP